MTYTPKLVVISVDGGTPEAVRLDDLFNFSWRFPERPTSVVRRLTSVYPSSTAAAHASMLTGAYPSGHGIIGNRFWEQTSVNVIRKRQYNPLLTLHPYAAESLRVPSIVDQLKAQGISSAGVHFPHAFSLRQTHGTPAVYCLYAPSRTLELTPTNGDVSAAMTTYFGEPVQLRVGLTGDKLGFLLDVNGVEVRLDKDRKTRVDFSIAAGDLSVGIAVDPSCGSNRLQLGTATLALRAGDARQDEPVCTGSGPSSLVPTYQLSGENRFFESPRAAWVESEARRIAERHRPEVLFVRFNQADHAQEFLHWHAIRGSARERAEAQDTIRSVYLEIGQRVNNLVGHFGPETRYMVFSDHGIDYVETHIRPNNALEELQLAHRMIFQGDSNCAFLYSDEPATPSEKRAILGFFADRAPGVHVIGERQATSLGLGPFEGRHGSMVIGVGAHTEFQYDEGPTMSAVRSASHGDLPNRSPMHGFLRTSGMGPSDSDRRRAHITDLAAIIRSRF